MGEQFSECRRGDSIVRGASRRALAENSPGAALNAVSGRGLERSLSVSMTAADPGNELFSNIYIYIYIYIYILLRCDPYRLEQREKALLTWFDKALLKWFDKAVLTCFDKTLLTWFEKVEHTTKDRAEKKIYDDQAVEAEH